jgi:chemotaxis family two-component system response regulator Rcp1
MTMNTGNELGRPIEILLVEDNPGDADIAREGLEASKVKNKLHVVADGEEAMAFLRKTGKYEQMPRPDLILLDLNLPRKDGREVLAEVKVDSELRHIPVVVLTSSDKEEDIIKSYQLYANCYITKPLKFTEFVKVVNSIESFWFTIVSFSTGPLK